MSVPVGLSPQLGPRAQGTLPLPVPFPFFTVPSPEKLEGIHVYNLPLPRPPPFNPKPPPLSLVFVKSCPTHSPSCFKVSVFIPQSLICFMY